MKNIKAKIKNQIAAAVFAAAVFAVNFTGCYSVFSGGTGGLVADKESTSVPKAGIANVDVYAYLDGGSRDSDFERWNEGTVFSPAADYYGHALTDSSGHFSISKLSWKENSPDFGRDGDYTTVWLLFYHENYGLTKGETIIISDSASDTVYAELTPIRKSTVLNLNFIDVATNQTTEKNIYVEVSVPQKTENQPNAEPKIYKTTVAGSGNLTVNYPRWKTNDDRENGTENTPEITISYVQSADEIDWAGCYNADNEEKNYAFLEDEKKGIKREIKNSSYSLNFYGKSQKLYMPSISGQFLSDSSEPHGTTADDGITISLKQIDSDGKFLIDCGQTSTKSQPLGTSGTEKHGVFENLGSGFFWKDTNYTGKFAETKVKIIAENREDKEKELTIRSDSRSMTVQL